jgi:hypothetical protein
VAGANSLYLRTDRSAAAREDAAMPTPRADALCPPAPATPPGDAAPTRADPTLPAAVFTDPVCPAGWYGQLPDHRSDHPYRFDYFDTFSPTSWGREVIWKATGLAAHLGLMDRPYDVVAEAVEPLSGNWAAYLTCADVYDNLAGAVADTARCMTDGAHTIGRVWTGNAAEACAQSMRSFATELDGVPGPLHRTADTYREVAEGAYRQGEAVAAILTLILDEVEELAFGPETVVMEGPLELATEAVDLVKVAEKIREVGKLIAKARETAQRDDGLGSQRAQRSRCPYRPASGTGPDAQRSDPAHAAGQRGTRRVTPPGREAVAAGAGQRVPRGRDALSDDEAHRLGA